MYTTQLIPALLLQETAGYNSFCHLRQPDGPNFYVAVLLEALKGIPCKGSNHLLLTREYSLLLGHFTDIPGLNHSPKRL